MIDLAILATAIIWLAATYVVFIRRQLGVCQPVSYLLLYHFLFHIVKPILWYYFDHNHAFLYMKYLPSDNEIVFSLLVSNIGLVCSLSIFLMFFKFTNSQIRNRLRAAAAGATWSLNNKIVAMGMLFLSMLAFVQRVRGYLGEGGEFQQAQDALTGQRVFVSGGGWWFEFSVVFVFAGIYLWLRSRLDRRYFFLMVVCCVAWLAVGYSRYVFVYAVIAAFVTIYVLREINFRYTVFAGCAGMVLITIFMVLGANRSYVRDLLFHDGGGPVVVSNWDRKSLFDTLDLSTFETQTALIHAVPDLTDGYTYFLQHLRLFTEPVPRALWSGKPFGDPIQMFDINRYVNVVSLSTGWYGEGWQSLGLVGVIVTCILYALLSTVVMRNLLLSGRFNSAFAYIVLLPLHLQWLRDGVLFSVVKFSLFMCLPAIVDSLLPRAVRRRGIVGVMKPRPRIGS